MSKPTSSDEIFAAKNELQALKKLLQRAQAERIRLTDTKMRASEKAMTAMDLDFEIDALENSIEFYNKKLNG